MNSVHDIARTLLGILVVTATAFAVDVQYVGRIDDGLRAPTSLDIRQDRLAILEPFSRELKLFTTGGVITHQIQLEGGAHSLLSISESVYLFCDREGARVIGIDINQPGQFDFLAGQQILVDPIDILANDSRINILDAELKEILIFDESRQLQKRLPLRDAENRSIGFPSSFAFDPVRQQYYVFDQIASVVWVVSADGEFKNKFTSFGAGDGEITRGGEILCGSDGLVYISDRFQSRVAVFSPEGKFETHVDLSQQTGARLYIPTGLAIDNEGLLYVASTESHAIEVFHIENSAAELSWHLRQVYPAPYDTVSPNGIDIIVEAEVFGDPALITGFDFELYYPEDHTTPLLADTNVSSEISEVENSQASVTARWHVGQLLQADRSYDWRARVRTDNIVGQWTGFRQFATSSLPMQFHLEQNYPNPFNPETHIQFTLPEIANVELAIFNLLGQQLKTFEIDNASPGEHEISWDGRDESGNRVSSGVYFYRLIAGEHARTRKMVLIK